MRSNDSSPPSREWPAGFSRRTSERGRTLIRTQIHIDAPPEEVFAVLADGAGYARWVVGARCIRAVNRGFPEPGSRLQHSMGIRLMTLDGDTLVTRSEPPELLGLEAHGGPIKAMVRFRLRPDETGTTVVMEEDGSAAFTRLVTRLAGPLVAARNADTLWRLKQEILTRANGGPTVTEAETRAALPRWLADATARVFGLAAAARRARALHPKGVTRVGQAQLIGAGRHLVGGSSTAVAVRFSRGIGLPARLPDFNGLGIRFFDAFGVGRHQDLLLTSAAPGCPGALPFPAVTVTASRFSSIVRYRVDGVPLRFAARVVGSDLTFDHLAEPARLEIALSAEGDGHREQVAVIVLDEVIDGSAIDFAPMLTGPNVVPLGLLNALRRPAYDASQAVRIGSRSSADETKPASEKAR